MFVQVLFYMMNLGPLVDLRGSISLYAALILKVSLLLLLPQHLPQHLHQHLPKHQQGNKPRPLL